MAAKQRSGKPSWDAAPKVRADAKLKNLPESDQETLWLLLHPTDPDTPPKTLEDVLVHIESDHGFGVSLSTLSEWRSWYALKRRMDAAAERALQTKLELAKDPSLSPEDIERVAQTIFTAETLESGNVKGFVALAKLRLQARAVENDSRRIALLEAAAAEAKAKLEAATAKAKAAGGISEETLREIEAAANLL